MRAQDQHYSLCVAAYYNPADPAREIVRSTAIVTDLRTNVSVDRIEATAADSPDTWSDAVIALSVKYNAQISVLSEPVPLAPCPCCDGYLDRTMTREDIANAERAALPLRPRPTRPRRRSR